MPYIYYYTYSGAKQKVIGNRYSYRRRRRDVGSWSPNRRPVSAICAAEVHKLSLETAVGGPTRCDHNNAAVAEAGSRLNLAERRRRLCSFHCRRSADGAATARGGQKAAPNTNRSGFFPMIPYDRPSFRLAPLPCPPPLRCPRRPRLNHWWTERLGGVNDILSTLGAGHLSIAPKM